MKNKISNPTNIDIDEVLAKLAKKSGFTTNLFTNGGRDLPEMPSILLDAKRKAAIWVMVSSRLWTRVEIARAFGRKDSGWVSRCAEEVDREILVSPGLKSTLQKLKIHAGIEIASPCPFCGVGGMVGEAHGIWRGDIRRYTVVRCQNKDCHIKPETSAITPICDGRADKWPTVEDALMVWNKRF